MNKRIIYITIGLALIFLITNSCQTSFTNRFREGLINYKITYLDDESENPVISLLPENMSIKFKDGNSMSKIEGFLGFFSTSYIIDYKNNQAAALLKIIDKKYLYQGAIEDSDFLYEKQNDVKYKYLDEKKTIAGFNCKKIRAITNDTIDLFYTDEIKFDYPNSSTPYSEIDAVLLEFQMKVYGINMRFTAESVESKKIDKSEFSIPDDYESISKSEFVKLIEELL